MGSPQCASIIEFFPGKQPQQQPQDPQPLQELHPELGLIQSSAPAISNPRIPASLCVARVKPVPTIKNIAPMILLQFFEPGLQSFFIISPNIHHITIIDHLISICQYLETYRSNRSLDLRNLRQFFRGWMEARRAAVSVQPSVEETQITACRPPSPSQLLFLRLLFMMLFDNSLPLRAQS